MAEAVERRGAVPHHGRRRELRVVAEGLGETLEEAVRRDGLGEHLPHALLITLPFTRCGSACSDRAPPFVDFGSDAAVLKVRARVRVTVTVTVTVRVWVRLRNLMFIYFWFRVTVTVTVTVTVWVKPNLVRNLMCIYF